MKSSVGTSTSIYLSRLPYQRRLQRAAKMLGLSREAKPRLNWLSHYKKHKSTYCPPLVIYFFLPCG